MSLANLNQESFLDTKSLLDLPFEISAIAHSLWDSSYVLGSYDGRMASVSDASGQVIVKPFTASHSGEAINAIAFQNDCLAISTREDITIFRSASCDMNEANWIFSSFEHGAHGLVPCPGHGFLAPLGPNGLLRIETNPASDGTIVFDQMGMQGLPVYYYRAISISRKDSSRSICVSAVRNNGVAVIDPSLNGSPGTGLLLGWPNSDIIDVRCLESKEYPFAVVALGRDGCIYSSHDILEKPLVLRVGRPFGGETAYKILVRGENLLVHTNKNIILLPNLADVILGTTSRPNGQVSCVRVAIDAVDVLDLANNLAFVGAHSKGNRLELAPWDSLFASNVRRKEEVFTMESIESKTPPRSASSYIKRAG